MVLLVCYLWLAFFWLKALTQRSSSQFLSNSLCLILFKDTNWSTRLYNCRFFDLHYRNDQSNVDWMAWVGHRHSTAVWERNLLVTYSIQTRCEQINKGMSVRSTSTSVNLRMYENIIHHHTCLGRASDMGVCATNVVNGNMFPIRLLISHKL